MSNPFDSDAHEFAVLVNAAGQHSLWPDFLAPPSGWTAVHHGQRRSCLAYIEANWLDIRPAELTAARRS